jgi:hypothetical protein
MKGVSGVRTAIGSSLGGGGFYQVKLSNLGVKIESQNYSSDITNQILNPETNEREPVQMKPFYAIIKDIQAMKTPFMPSLNIFKQRDENILKEK